MCFSLFTGYSSNIYVCICVKIINSDLILANFNLVPYFLLFSVPEPILVNAGISKNESDYG